MGWIRRKRSNKEYAEWGPGAFAGFASFRYGERKKTASTKQSIHTSRERDQILLHVVEALGIWQLSRFENEGRCRAGLRARFCLQGHPWNVADCEATSIVSEGLRRIGAVRPSFEEGQHEYLIARENCKRCGSALSESDIAVRRRFCSPECINSARAYRAEVCSFYEKQAYKHAFYLDKKKAAQERNCALCGAVFYSIRRDQKYCSTDCLGKTRINTSRIVRCECCGEEFRSRSSLAKMGKYCGLRCYKIARAAGEIKQCEGCGVEFACYAAHGKFCTSQCRDSDLSP